MLYEFTQPFIMDSSEFTRRFGVQATPMKQAIAESVAFARQIEAAHAAQALKAA
jgi:hypothetical protein